MAAMYRRRSTKRHGPFPQLEPPAPSAQHHQPDHRLTSTDSPGTANHSRTAKLIASALISGRRRSVSCSPGCCDGGATSETRMGINLTVSCPRSSRPRPAGPRRRWRRSRLWAAPLSRPRTGQRREPARSAHRQTRPCAHLHHIHGVGGGATNTGQIEVETSGRTSVTPSAGWSNCTSVAAPLTRSAAEPTGSKSSPASSSPIGPPG